MRGEPTAIIGTPRALYSTHTDWLDTQGCTGLASPRRGQAHASKRAATYSPVSLDSGNRMKMLEAAMPQPCRCDALAQRRTWAALLKSIRRASFRRLEPSMRFWSRGVVKMILVACRNRRDPSSLLCRRRGRCEQRKTAHQRRGRVRTRAHTRARAVRRAAPMAGRPGQCPGAGKAARQHTHLFVAGGTRLDHICGGSEAPGAEQPLVVLHVRRHGQPRRRTASARRRAGAQRQVPSGR